MARAIIIYGTTTGNTEYLANNIAEGMKAAGVDVTVQNVTGSSVNDLMDYDTIVLGCSTWGDGELQDDFISFFEDLEDVSLDGKKAAAFGPGDSSYEMFCGAVDLLKERLQECGAQTAMPPLKVDGDVMTKAEEARNWGKQLASVSVTPKAQ